MERSPKAALVAAIVACLYLIPSYGNAAQIHEAVEQGNLSMVEALIEGDPSQAMSWDDPQQRAPLHVAAQKDMLDIARALLDGGADPNAVTEQKGEYAFSGIGVSPLHIAAGKGSEKMALLLIERGADIESRTVAAWTRMRAEGHSDFDALRELDAQAKCQGKTPLHFAAIRGEEATALLLIERGADINARDDMGNTPAHLAAYYGRNRMLALLNAKGADLSLRSAEGWSMAHFAAAGGNESTLAMVLKKSPDVNGRACVPGGKCWDITPLHLAAIAGDERMASLLLAKGADPNARAAHGSTPLHLATSSDRSFADARSAADRAPGAPMQDRAVAAHLLAAGADPNARDENGCTPLHIATLKGRKELAAILVNQGADTEAKNNEGQKPAELTRNRADSTLAGVVRD